MNREEEIRKEILGLRDELALIDRDKWSLKKDKQLEILSKNIGRFVKTKNGLEKIISVDLENEIIERKSFDIFLKESGDLHLWIDGNNVKAHPFLKKIGWKLEFVEDTEIKELKEKITQYFEKNLDA